MPKHKSAEPLPKGEEEDGEPHSSRSCKDEEASVDSSCQPQNAYDGKDFPEVEDGATSLNVYPPPPLYGSQLQQPTSPSLQQLLAGIRATVSQLTCSQAAAPPPPLVDEEVVLPIEASVPADPAMDYENGPSSQRDPPWLRHFGSRHHHNDQSTAGAPPNGESVVRDDRLTMVPLSQRAVATTPRQAAAGATNGDDDTCSNDPVELAGTGAMSPAGHRAYEDAPTQRHHHHAAAFEDTVLLALQHLATSVVALEEWRAQAASTATATATAAATCTRDQQRASKRSRSPEDEEEDQLHAYSSHSHLKNREGPPPERPSSSPPTHNLQASRAINNGTAEHPTQKAPAATISAASTATALLAPFAASMAAERQAAEATLQQARARLAHAEALLSNALAQVSARIA